MPDQLDPPVDATGAAVFPIAPAAGRGALEATARAAPLPVPGVLLSLGAVPPPPLTYDAAGLLRALEKAAPALTTVPPPQASDVDVASLAGVNGDVVRSGALNSLVGLRAVPANGLGAVQGLLRGEDLADRNLSLRTVLRAALERGATGLDPVHTASAVLNVSGALHTLAPRSAAQALAGLRGGNLGLSAAALGVNPGNPMFFNGAGSLLLLPSGDDTSLSLAGLLAANLDLANARFDASLTAQPSANTGTSVTLSDALAGDVTMSMAAMNTAFAQGTIAGTPPVPLAVPGAIARPAAAPPLAPAVPPLNAGTSGNTVAATLTTMLPGVPAPVPLGAAPTAALALSAPTPEGATTVVNFNFLLDAAAQAARTIAGNPNYAAMATALYGNATIFRAAQPDVGAPGTAGGGTDFPRPVGEATNIRPVRTI